MGSAFGYTIDQESLRTLLHALSTQARKISHKIIESPLQPGARPLRPRHSDIYDLDMEVKPQASLAVIKPRSAMPRVQCTSGGRDGKAVNG